VAYKEEQGGNDRHLQTLRALNQLDLGIDMATSEVKKLILQVSGRLQASKRAGLHQRRELLLSLNAISEKWQDKSEQILEDLREMLRSKAPT